MKFPIDVNQMMFVATAQAEPVVDFDTKRPKADENGEPLYAMQVAAIAEGTAEIISVKVAGKPPAVDAGRAVRVAGLVATPWQMGERSGVAYRAEKIEPLAASAPSGASR